MCYNIAINTTREEIANAFNLFTIDTDWQGPNKYMTLGQYIPAIVESEEGRSLQTMYWGFTPFWEKNPKGGMKPGNAKAETIASTPMFRTAFKSKRCIIPATGFFEWQGEKGSKELLPFIVPGRDIIAFPGVWDDWTTGDGVKRRSFAIVTADPNADIRPYHDRMPVILEKGAEDLWLSASTSAEELRSLLIPLSDGEIRAQPENAFKPVRTRSAS